MEPGERLLWSGQPQQRLGFWEIAGGLFPIAAIFFHAHWWEWTLAGFAALGLVVNLMWRANTFYGITDGRIIILAGAKLQSNPVADIISVDVKKTVGETGSLIFVIWERGKQVKRGFYFVSDVDAVGKLIESLRQDGLDAAHA